jgi:uncharacterized protein (DUF924 family)
MATFDSLLDYWFGELTDGFADAGHRANWFNGGKAFDSALRREFGHLVDAASTPELRQWLETPRGRLAYVLVYDQLPRNIFRGERRAFATDQLALAAAREGVEAGADLELALEERSFLYMPFEHSESLIDQHTCVGLFMALRDETPKGKRELTGNSLRYAQQHRDIIRRFGRFPHRNAVLGRTATPEEEEFVAAGSGFGQS